MNKKPKFSIDENNDLYIEKNGQKLSVQGRFSTDNHNRLIYWLNQPYAWQRKYRLDKAFVFEGQWRLNANHDLELRLDKSDLWQKDAVLTLKGDIISSDNDKLIFQIKSKERCRHTQIYLLKLDGYWQADKHNRLNFAVKKAKAPADILALSGNWQVNQNQKIVYSYEKTNLKTKTKVTQRLIFSGYWQINSAQRLSYILSSGCKSGFDFRAQIESPNLYPADGVIKYRLGAGARAKRSFAAPRIIYLYGTWKFGRKFELYF